MFDFRNRIFNKKLSNEDNLKLDRLYARKERINLEIGKVDNILKPLIAERKELVYEMNNISGEICNIKGHELEINTGYMATQYGLNYVCRECGKYLTDMDVREDDMVIDNEHKYVRVLYKR